jgi:hypothetical protein
MPHHSSQKTAYFTRTKKCYGSFLCLLSSYMTISMILLLMRATTDTTTTDTATATTSYVDAPLLLVGPDSSAHSKPLGGVSLRTAAAVLDMDMDMDQPSSTMVERPNATRAGKPLSFYFVHTTDEASFDIGNVRAVESVFFHHPNAQVSIFHKDANFTLQPFKHVIDAGYTITLQHYKNLREMIESALGSPSGGSTINATLAHTFIAKIPEYEKTQFWYVCEADFMRALIIYTRGGIYIDTDIIIVKPLDDLRNTVGLEKPQSVNNAVQIFDQYHSFTASLLNEMFATFNPDIWGYNGPMAVTRALKKIVGCRGAFEKQNTTLSCPVNILPQTAFYPMGWNKVMNLCFKKGTDHSQMKKNIESSSFMVHINNRATGYEWKKDGQTTPNSLCRWLYNSFCVACGDTPI